MSESENAGEPFGQHALSLTAFLGGITFAVLILIIQADELTFVYQPIAEFTRIPYSELLIDILAVVCVLFIMSSVGYAAIAILSFDHDSGLAKIVNYISVSAVVGLLFFIPLLLLPFSMIGTIAVVITEATCIFFLLKFGIE